MANKTIDGQVEKLATASHCFDSQFREDARRILLEVAREQRAACGNALVETYGRRKGGKVLGETAYQAVINAEIK